MVDQQNNKDGPAEQQQAQERARLEEISQLDLFSEEAHASLQEIADEAARTLEVPIALVSIVLNDAQFFAASHGLTGWLAETQGTPAEWSFCANAVESGQPFIVEDAQHNQLVQDNPLVTQDGIRCYYGIPLKSRGHVLGTLCVIGTEARSFEEDEVAKLRRLADEAMQRIEQRRRSG